MAKILGVGGVFIKSKNPEKLKKWYADTLGMQSDKYGILFQEKTNTPDESIQLQWSVMNDSSDYFDPSKAKFMINYRVDDIETMYKSLKTKNVEIIGDMQVFEYGKFLHLLDCDGNKIELWEPVQGAF